MEKYDTLFSESFEKELISKIFSLVRQSLELSQSNDQRGFIKRENAQAYFDSISEGTLIKYEDLGLKRYQPVEGGTVFYRKEDLDEFMLQYKILQQALRDTGQLVIAGFF